MPASTWRLAPGWALATAGLSVGSALASLAVPRLVGHSLDRLTTTGDARNDLLRLAAALLVVTVCSAGSSLCNGAYAALVTQRLRGRAVTAVTDRDARDLPTAGDLATRLLVDAAQPAAALGIIVTMALSAATLVVGLVSIALIDWWVLVGLLGGLVALIAVVRQFVADSTPALEAYRVGQARIADRALDAQRGAASIQAHGTWRAESARVLAPLSAVRIAGRSLWALQGRMAWRSGIFVPAALLVTLAVGGLSLGRGRISAGEFAALIGYAALVIGALDGVEAAAGLASVRVGTRRLAELAVRRGAAEESPAAAGSLRGWSPRRSAPHGPVSLTLTRASITGAGNLSDEDASTVPVDLHVPPGHSVAVTGPPRVIATVARQATGAATPTHGRVEVNGIPLGDLAPDAHVVALAGARPALLGETVAGLLTLGLDGIDHALVRRAAAQARIDHVIEALPGGYATPLAELVLSGGELQRLGIAQALLHGSGLLALEEATSSLDPATELEVVHALLGTRGERTLLIASGRPALAAVADHTVDLTPDVDVDRAAERRPADDDLALSGETR